MGLKKSLLTASFCISAAVLAAGMAGNANSTPANGAIAPANLAAAAKVQDAVPTATPIKHLVVIFDENISFDHYFATYPFAANPPGEPKFHGSPHTPTVNNLINDDLLTNNPNFTNTLNGVNAAEPFRLDRSQAATADQNHGYTAEQQATDGGNSDLFPLYTGAGTPGGVGAFGTKGQVMGYYDGNTVTALWNYAQAFAMDDNAYTDTYGPSTPGAVEVVSGQTNGLKLIKSSYSSYYVNDTQGGLTLTGDVDPGYDVCSSKTDAAIFTGKNIGDLLNEHGITWGGFMGGFALDVTNPNGTTGCARSTLSPVVGALKADYVPHHAWFQYYPSTANPTHALPTSLQAIGYSYAHNGVKEAANHQYDLLDFYAALYAGNFPSVSYIKFPSYQDGHAGYSDPLDEQVGLVTLINYLQSRPDWKNTAVIVAWDDSDGWYDHAAAYPTSASYDSVQDQLDGAGKCGSATPPDGVLGKPVNGRCGPGTRLPFLVISPWAKFNYVDGTRITQASVVKFIEDNWLHGERLGGGAFDADAGSIEGMFNFHGFGYHPYLFLDAATGEPLPSHH